MQEEKGKMLQKGMPRVWNFPFCTCMVLPDDGHTNGRNIIGSNKLNVHKCRCCDCLDWTVSDDVKSVNYLLTF